MRTLFSFILTAAVLWFAVANAEPVTLHLFLWDVTASLSLAVGIPFMLGFLLGLLWLTPSYWRKRSDVRMSENTLAETKKERDMFAERSRILEEQGRHPASPKKEHVPTQDTQSR